MKVRLAWVSGPVMKMTCCDSITGTFMVVYYKMASMISNETLHLLLQNKFDRIENLVQMNHAATLAIPSIIAAIWGISFK
jgi:hypothetical protein